MHLDTLEPLEIEVVFYEVKIKFKLHKSKKEFDVICSCAIDIASKDAAINFLLEAFRDCSENTFALKEAKYLVDYLYSS